MTAGSKRVCGGSTAAQTGVAPALEDFFGVRASGICCSPSYRPTYSFQTIVPGSGRTMQPDHGVCRHGPRYSAFLLSRYLPAELAEQLVVVIQSIGGKSPEGFLWTLTENGIATFPPPARQGFILGALRTRSALLATGPNGFYQTNLARVGRTDRGPKVLAHHSISGSFATFTASTPFPHERLTICSAFANIRSSAAT